MLRTMTGFFLLAAAGSTSAQQGREWGLIKRPPDGVSLIYGVPDSDILTYELQCRAGKVELSYSLEREDRAYGSQEQTSIELRTGGDPLHLNATATFDDGGSPRIVTQQMRLSDLVRLLSRHRRVETTDAWEHSWVPPIPSALLKRWSSNCGD